MIEKVENPLDLTIDQVEMLVAELQLDFDTHSKNLPEFLSLEEIGISTTLKTCNGTSGTYNLAQLKLLKAEMLDPTMNSIKEIS